MKNCLVYLVTVLLLASLLSGCGSGKVRDDGGLITAAPTAAPTIMPTVMPEQSPSASPMPSDNGGTGNGGTAGDAATASPSAT